MVIAKGIFERGRIILDSPVDLPDGAEVEVTIRTRASAEEQAPADVQASADELARRQRAATRLLARAPVKIAPLSVRDLIEHGRKV